MRLLDLFCGAGGAAAGYARAGFEVVGVDHEPQPRYPFEFHRADALEALAAHGREFDAVHASPPCQDHSALHYRAGLHGTGALLATTRDALLELGRPYVIENVPGADMARLIELCGSMFGLGANGRVLRRHRWFEASLFVLVPPDQCAGQDIGGVYGDGGAGDQTRGYRFHPDEARAAMGIDWMNRVELSQAVPPAYTEFLGEALLDQAGQRWQEAAR
jgi:DNA (cytosine-5)-methyltransferase 1